MSFELDFSADPSAQVRETALARLRRARRQLVERPDGIDGAVHEARKDLKKLRALARLVRGASRKATYRRVNGMARDAARELSGIRDLTALRETTAALRERFAPEHGPELFDDVDAALERARQGLSSDQVEARVRAALERIDVLEHEVVPSWRIEGRFARAIESGLVRTYRRGAAALRRAAAEATTENLHEWRKRVKYHRYHLRLARTAWRPVIGAQRDEVKALSDHLGDDHDLAVLTDWLETEDLDLHRARLEELIQRRRLTLQTEAFRVGALAYAEKPKALGRRLRAWVDASSRPQQLPAAPAPPGPPPAVAEEG